MDTTTPGTIDDREAHRPLAISHELDLELNAMARENPRVAHALRLQWTEMSGYMIEAGRKVDSVAVLVRNLSRFIYCGAIIIALIMLFFGIVNVVTLRNQSNDAQHIAQEAQQIQSSIQTSRFDSTYYSCIATNERHENALTYTGSLTKINPSAGILAVDLLNTLAPLRDGKNGRISCLQYAAQQTSLAVPPYAPKPPASTG